MGAANVLESGTQHSRCSNRPDWRNNRRSDRSTHCIDLNDTRNGLTFDVGNYTPTPTPVSLTIANRNDAAGTFTLVIDDSSWDLISSDPELDINAVDCVCFTGRIKISFPATTPTPAEDNIIFLMFLVRSDGVVVV
jgi:hypothetical protein